MRTKRPKVDPAKQKVWYKRHYEKNKVAILAKIRANNKKRIAAATDYVAEYLLANPCIDCGESDLVCLDFDHRDRAQKSFNISSSVRSSGVSVENLAVEIAKCDVRCANCHRRRTAAQMGWWRHNYIGVADGEASASKPLTMGVRISPPVPSLH